MNLETIIDALLQKVEWTPTIAAKHLGASLAVVNWLDEPELYKRNDPTKLVPRTVAMLDEQPPQVWTRYRDFDEIAFVVTSVKTPRGEWATDSAHRVNVYTARQFIDPHGTEYVMEQYESATSFAYVLGVPDFIHAVRKDGIEWVAP